MDQQLKGFTQREVGQKLVFMLDGNRTRNKGYAQKPTMETNTSHLRFNSTSISVQKAIQEMPRNNNVIRKRETISGNHTTHTRKSTHRVENSSRILQQQQQQQQSTSRTQQHKERTLNQVQVLGNSEVDNDYDSDDIFDSEKADLKLLKLVKKTLLNYIEEIPSRKLKSGEYTWSEIKPYIRDMHYPRFRKYLLDREIQAPIGMIVKCLKDLHISRRDVLLKKQRKLREQRTREKIDNMVAQSPRSDGYVAFEPREPRVIIRN